MYLAYLDDSDTRAKKSKWQVLAAVIVKDDSLKFARLKMSAASEFLMGEGNLDKFEEFHACELYGGHKAFEGIEQSHRFGAIGYLLGMLADMNMSVIYGAVNLDDLRKDVFGSADPVDVCFRKCMAHIKEWASETLHDNVTSSLGEYDDDTEKWSTALMEEMQRNLVILIADECDGKTKHTLQQSFRQLGRLHPLDCFHDDMYFGDSRYSSGIQLADLCAYFIARHLEGDEEIEHFYKKIEPRLYPRPESPTEKLSNLKQLLELTNGNQESGIQNVREGDGNDPSGKPNDSESSDGSGETGTSDGSATNWKKEQGPTT